MASLPETLRRQLEGTVVEARDVAEAGARAALERLAVGFPKPFAELSPEEGTLRVQLRAHARQLGDPSKESGEQEIRHLVAECAYENWHRMLFARFLAENRLLIHPEHGVPVSLAECEELASETGEEDGWALAGRFAARMLPAIFRPDDPVLSVRFAPEHQQALEMLLAGLPAEVFTADDSLGWVYQFWQTKRKKEVNESGRKIGADELPAVTQLFTEPYMVQFLLHNTLGAWWAGKVLTARPELAATAASEEDLRRACALPGCEWTYLRFVRAEEGDHWRPAAGVFEGWPEHAGQITVLDPCCGSGHFLVEAFRILLPMRMAEEALSAREASDAVLRDNLFGLEIDERCTQIAAFNIALAAWRYPGAGGYRPLPELHIACSGLSVGAKEEEWLNLAGKDDRVREGMRQLYRIFKNAPTLGSLIDPRREEAELFKAGFEELQPLLAQAIEREDVKRDAQTTEAGITAQGMAKAAALLARLFTLVITNVPFLTQIKFAPALDTCISEQFALGKANLATAFMLRMLGSLNCDGSVAFVSPQSWWFLKRYARLRSKLLNTIRIEMLVRLGERAFQSAQAGGEQVGFSVLSLATPDQKHKPVVVDVSEAPDAKVKATTLASIALRAITQHEQLINRDSVILFSNKATIEELAAFATALCGSRTSDSPHFVRCLWEIPAMNRKWEFHQTTVSKTVAYGGMNEIILWEQETGELARFAESVRMLNHAVQNWRSGKPNWGKRGVVVSQMGRFPSSLYTGAIYDPNCCAIVPIEEKHLVALWVFCSSNEFGELVKQINQNRKVEVRTFLAVPFDLSHWQQVAAEKYPNGLPEPESDEPTQWLFHGRPEASTAPLQVAVARLLGYRWPPELDEKMRLSRPARALVQRCDELFTFADDNGIVCIPPVRGEQPAADRLERLLSDAFGATWTPAIVSTLLDQVGFSGKTLEEWLREGFFEQHCQLFLQRPFVWHIWDGRRRDGFAALVNYHKFDRKLLERLAYTVLGDWIARQRQGAKAGERGAEDRLAAAEALQNKLALILEGEPPYDIFVRWKPLYEQSIGWEPDLNDGVRMNIRPFVEAGILRKDPRIKWAKDRGAEPQSFRAKEQFPWFWRDGQFTGDRVNDVHLTNAEKRPAREWTQKAGSGH